MNAFTLTEAQVSALRIADWYRISKNDLNTVIAHLFEDTASRPMIRTGQEIIPAPSYAKGVPPQNIEREFDNLADQTATILATMEFDARIRAAAFFHLRFEGIHALTDGNGRVGRFIMMKQCLPEAQLDVRGFMNSLFDNERFYRAVFLAQISDEQRYELLIDLLARILEQMDPAPRFTLPFPLTPDDVERVGGRFRFIPFPVSDETRALLK
jgi:hypothetical protein